MTNQMTTDTFFDIFHKTTVKPVNVKMLNAWLTENFMHKKHACPHCGETIKIRKEILKDETLSLTAASFAIVYNKTKTKTAFINIELIGKFVDGDNPLNVDVYESGEKFISINPTFIVNLKASELIAEGYTDKDMTLKKYMGNKFNFSNARISHNMKHFVKWYNS